MFFYFWSYTTGSTDFEGCWNAMAGTQMPINILVLLPLGRYFHRNESSEYDFLIN
jgi:hypothetical protein